MKKAICKQITVKDFDDIIIAILLGKQDEFNKSLQEIRVADIPDSLSGFLQYLQYIQMKFQLNTPLDKRISILEEAKQQFLAVKNFYLAMEIQEEIYLISPTFGKYSKIVSGLEELVEARKQNYDMIGYSHTLSALGLKYIDGNEHEKAISTFLSAIEQEHKNRDLSRMAEHTVNLTNIYMITGELAQALFYAKKSIALIEEYQKELEQNKEECGAWIPMPSGYMRIPIPRYDIHIGALTNYGNIMEKLGDYNESLSVYQKALEQTRYSAHYATQKGVILNQIGELNRLQGNLEKAAENYRASKNLFEQQGITGYYIAVVAMNLGDVERDLHYFDIASELYETALGNLKETDDVSTKAEVIARQGELLFLQGNYNAAIPMLEQALEQAQSVSAFEVVVRVLRISGSVMLKKNAKNAQNYLTRALLIAEERNLKTEEQLIHKELSSFYRLYGDTALALHHFEKFHNLKQEIFSAEADRRLKNLQIVHEVEKFKGQLQESDQTIRLLKNELDEKTSELNAMALRILEKKEFMEMIENGLQKIIEANPDKKDIVAKNLLNTLRSDQSLKKNWQEFTEQFMIVHKEFIGYLLRCYPDISPAEIKVCVLLRLSLGTKEIADLLSLSIRTVESHRMRIRKKLGLGEHDSITTFLISLGNQLLLH